MFFSAQRRGTACPAEVQCTANEAVLRGQLFLLSQPLANGLVPAVRAVPDAAGVGARDYGGVRARKRQQTVETLRAQIGVAEEGVEPVPQPLTRQLSIATHDRAVDLIADPTSVTDQSRRLPAQGDPLFWKTVITQQAATRAVPMPHTASLLGAAAIPPAADSATLLSRVLRPGTRCDLDAAAMLWSHLSGTFYTRQQFVDAARALTTPPVLPAPVAAGAALADGVNRAAAAAAAAAVLRGQAAAAAAAAAAAPGPAAVAAPQTADVEPIPPAATAAANAAVAACNAAIAAGGGGPGPALGNAVRIAALQGAVRAAARVAVTLEIQARGGGLRAEQVAALRSGASIGAAVEQVVMAVTGALPAGGALDANAILLRSRMAAGAAESVARAALAAARVIAAPAAPVAAGAAGVLADLAAQRANEVAVVGAVQGAQNQTRADVRAAGGLAPGGVVANLQPLEAGTFGATIQAAAEAAEAAGVAAAVAWRNVQIGIGIGAPAPAAVPVVIPSGAAGGAAGIYDPGAGFGPSVQDLFDHYQEVQACSDWALDDDARVAVAPGWNAETRGALAAFARYGTLGVAFPEYNVLADARNRGARIRTLAAVLVG